MNEWLAAKNILAVRLDNIGDVIMLGPALRAVKETSPQAQLTLLASPAGSNAVPLLPWIDDVITWRPVWQDVAESTVKAAISATGRVPRRDIVPRAYRTLQINKAALKNLLAAAPPESSGPIGTAGVELEIPLPSGGFGRFLVQESPIMEDKLAAKFPQIKTYVGQGIDDPTATMRIDVTPRGAPDYRRCRV